MGILSDRQIEAEVEIIPFTQNLKRENTISYGVSSYGYDVRIGHNFKVFTPSYGAVIDPKNFNEKAFVEIKVPENQPDNYLLIPPNSFALGYSLEKLKIPRDALAICLGKSTYARCGIIVNVTPLEPEWEGHVTIELSNTAPIPAKVYAGEGIMQVLFLRSDEITHSLEETTKLIFEGTKSLIFDKDPENVKQIQYIIGNRGSCEISYADKKGKYQNQKQEVTLPQVDKLK